MSEEQVIRILARPQMNASRCDFEVDRSVAPGVTWFSGKSAAEGSPLAEALFALKGVQQVLVRDTVVTVTKNDSVPWPELARAVGTTIRAQIQSGKPLVKEGLSASSNRDESILEEVTRIVEEEINPAVAAHGGFIHIQDVKGGVVSLIMGGGCQGCASSAATLRMGVEQAIRQRVPEVVDIVDVTDHASGHNPYYSST